MRDIMIDLETMGTAPNAAIVAIGAVEFDLDSYTLGEQFYCTIDLESSVNAGGVMEARTILWWLDQENSVRQEITGKSLSLFVALLDFRDWMTKRGDADELAVWGNGAAFDNVILASAFSMCGLRLPWNPKNSFCYKTLKIQHPEIKLKRIGTPHNALDDAKSQALHLLRIFKSLKAQEQGQEQKQKLTMEYMLRMQENEMAETEPDLSPRQQAKQEAFMHLDDIEALLGGPIDSLIQWQPIETVPDELAVDVWIGSLDNPEFGARVTSVHRIGSRWFGIPDYYNTERVKATHWMPLPKVPNAPQRIDAALNSVRSNVKVTAND